MKDTEQYIRNLIEKDELWRFYKSKEWITLKQRILTENHYECQECKRNGIITRYDKAEDGSSRLISTVHHVQYVRSHPDLALSEFYEYKGQQKRNLIPVCKACHNRLHPEKRKTKTGYVNKERW